jgi:hypothetical protein
VFSWCETTESDFDQCQNPHQVIRNNFLLGNFQSASQNVLTIPHVRQYIDINDSTSLIWYMENSNPAVTRRHSMRILGTGTLAALGGCTTMRERVPFVGNDDEGEELHEHGYLFIEIDYEKVDFLEPKYVVEESDVTAHEFHFHDSDENPR